MTLRLVVESTDGPFTLSLLAFTVITLSLGRPHGSCGHAQPEAPAGIKHLPCQDFINASENREKREKEKGERKKERKKERERWMMRLDEL